MTDDDDDHAVDAALDLVSQGVTDLAGIPLPRSVKRSLWKALSTLITGVVDVPAAWLAARADSIRAESAARTFITARTAEVAAGLVAADPELSRRATFHLAGRLLREQQNRETATCIAIEDLRAAPPQEDSPSVVDDDWLDMFARIAEQRSNGEMQAYLGKLLAGEIRKPGSFAPATIQVLATITPRLAMKFQELCSVVLAFPNIPQLDPIVLSAPFGVPGANALAPFGFSYSELTELQDAGLLKHDLTAARGLTAGMFLTPTAIGSQMYIFGPSEGFTPEKKVQSSAVFLTESGQQLRTLVHMTVNQAYAAAAVAWICSSFGVHVKT